MMDITVQQKDCDALAGLFQHIVTDLRTSSPVWEDFLNKSLKLNTVLRTTAASMGAFLDAFQKVADLANNSHGATRELGAALTRLCIRHRSIETKLKTFASAIVEKLHEPLQGKIEEWKRVATQLDKDHNRDYKKAQQDIKKMSVDLPKLQKRANKGRLDARQKLDQILLSVSNKCQLLENAEMTAVRGVMLEEHARFCFFVDCMKPLMECDMSIMHELSRLQEVIDVISEHTSDAALLPQSGEQVLLDLKATNTTWKYQTPPGSPVLSSSLSRKSSLCSVDSSSSGSTHYSTSTQSPNRRFTLPLHASHSESSCVRQLSSISSQDSGFVSHDVLLSSEFSHNQDVSSLSVLKKASRGDNETAETSENVDTPVIFRPTVSNMLTHSASGPMLCSVSFRERPHTISAAYDRTLSRPQVTGHTFEPPYGFLKAPATTSIYATPTNVYRQTADIYARPTLCGRRFSQGAVAVAPPVVPPQYANCQKLRMNTAAAAAATDNKSTVSDKEEDIMQAQIHRSSSLPSPVYSDEAAGQTVGECRQLSSCGALNQLQQRRMLVKDDNYITHTYTALDARKQPASKDYESISEVINSNGTEVGESGKSLTLPRCHVFKVPQVPERKSSVDSGRNFTWRSNTLGRSSTRVKPSPPARSNSAKTNFTVPLSVYAVSCLTEQDVTSHVVQSRTEEDLCYERGTASTSWQPRQQAAPSDDSDVLFPSPPPELSCPAADAGAGLWPTVGLDSALFAVNSLTVQPDCSVDQNFVKTSEAAVELTDSAGVVTETSGGNSAETYGAENANSTLALIRKGMKLRKTVSNDRSAPKLN